MTEILTTPPSEIQPDHGDYSGWDEDDYDEVEEKKTELTHPPPSNGTGPGEPFSHADLIASINNRNKENATSSSGTSSAAGDSNVNENAAGEEKPISPGSENLSEGDRAILEKEKPVSSQRESEIRFFVEGFHELFFEISSQIKHRIAGTGNPRDYVPEPPKVERMNFYGTKIAEKHGWDKFMTYELGYFIALGRAELPSWRMVLQLKAQRDKLVKKDDQITKLVEQNEILTRQMTEWIKNGGPMPGSGKVGLSPDGKAKDEVNPDKLNDELVSNAIDTKHVGK